jgi:hypothetical protein
MTRCARRLLGIIDSLQAEHLRRWINGKGPLAHGPLAGLVHDPLRTGGKSLAKTYIFDLEEFRSEKTRARHTDTMHVNVLRFVKKPEKFAGRAADLCVSWKEA